MPAKDVIHSICSVCMHHHIQTMGSGPSCDENMPCANKMGVVKPIRRKTNASSIDATPSISTL